MNFLASIFGRDTKRGSATTAPAVPAHLIDRTDRRILPNAMRMYAAAKTDRTVADWLAPQTSADAEILTSRITTLSRTRQLERDDPYMRRILRLYENNVIGHNGIQLQCKAKDADGSYDTYANSIIETSWKLAGNATNCTTGRRLTRTDTRKLTVRAVVRDGGILWRKHPGYENDFSFSIQPIEIDRLDHNYNQAATSGRNCIRFGIEFDRFNSIVAYHILTRHPGDAFDYSAQSRFRERVPAEEIIGVWRTDRPEQTIGMPEVTSIMTRLNHLNRYDEAEVIAARVASCKGGFFERELASEGYEGEKDPQGNTISDVQPGKMEELPPGLKFVPNDPQHPTQAYASFIKSQLRGVASGAGLSYNALANDLEGVNYSSIRAGLLEDREEFKTFQQLIISQLEIPHFEAWLPFAILSGQIKLPMAKLWKFSQVEWKPRRWQWVDPKNDIEADVLAIENGLTSRRRIIAESPDSGDIEDIFDEQNEDNKLAAKKNLNFKSPDKIKADASMKTADKGGEVADVKTSTGSKDTTNKTATAEVTSGSSEELAASSDSLQASALNGAQVTALALIAAQVAGGELPLETAKGIAIASFPLIPADVIESIFKPLAGFKPVKSEPSSKPLIDPEETPTKE